MGYPYYLLLALLISSKMAMAAFYNVMDFGATPDGRTDSAKPFLAAWAAACRSNYPSMIYVPVGKFLVSQALFEGPCKGGTTWINAGSTIVAPSGYTNARSWIKFQYVQGLSIYGGTFDGQGKAFWSCKSSGSLSCPAGASSLYFGQVKNVVVSGVTLMNSEVFQMTIYEGTGVTVEGANIVAPASSPNTDGIHIQHSSYVTVAGSAVATGDDCISMGSGTTNVWIEDIKCGPGHGISIGSLGREAGEPGVQNITVRSIVFTGTQNGLRIKTWGTTYAGFVKDVKFEHVVMKDVQTPIVIDQNYCPYQRNCPGQSSGIKISQVLFEDVQGTSTSPVAVRLDCSPSNQCTGIRFQDIKLTSISTTPVQSYCKNVNGTASGTIIPSGCL